MSFKRDSPAALLDRIYANYTSLFRPFDKTPRHSLLKVFASVEAGMYHQLLWDLDFLSKQIFPDTADGECLREHWSSKTAPLYAVTAYRYEQHENGKTNGRTSKRITRSVYSGRRSSAGMPCGLSGAGTRRGRSSALIRLMRGLIWGIMTAIAGWTLTRFPRCRRHSEGSFR